MDLKRAAEGLTVVAVGVVLLANTLGYLSWSVWWSILSLWPLLIVAAGIDIVGRGTDNTWLRVFSSLLVIGGLFYGAFVMTPGGGWLPVITVNTSSDANDFELSEPHDRRVKTGVAEVSGGVGSLTVEAGRALASAAGETPFDEPVFSVRTAGTEARVTLGLGGVGQAWPSGSRSRLDVQLDESVVWDLTVQAGVTTTEVDASDLMLSAVSMDAGVSDTELTLGRIASAVSVTAIPVRVKAGVSSITIRIPQESQARVLIRGGLSAIHMDDGLDRVSGGTDKVYETGGFDIGDAYYDIVIEAGLGDISVELY